MSKNPDPPQPQAMRIAFEKHIRQEYTLLDCLTDYTFEVDSATGDYSNCSVSMAWRDWKIAWHAAVEAAQPKPEPANLYQWREDANRTVLEQPVCPTCNATIRAESTCYDTWHSYKPAEQPLDKEKYGHIMACGRHSNRYGEDDGVWDTSCFNCTERADAIKKVLGLVAHQLKAMRALESLTPSGSEFVGDVERCVKFISDAREMLHRGMHMWAKRAHEAEAREQNLRDALQLCLTELWRVPAQGYDKWRIATSTAEKVLNP